MDFIESKKRMTTELDTNKILKQAYIETMATCIYKNTDNNRRVSKERSTYIAKQLIKLIFNSE